MPRSPRGFLSRDFEREGAELATNTQEALPFCPSSENMESPFPQVRFLEVEVGVEEEDLAGVIVAYPKDLASVCRMLHLKMFHSCRLQCLDNIFLLEYQEATMNNMI